MTLKLFSLLSISILLIALIGCTDISYNTSNKKEPISYQTLSTIPSVNGISRCGNFDGSFDGIGDGKNAGSYNCSLLSGTNTTIKHKNILGQTLQSCSTNPITGYERDGYCKTGPQDPANHSVCAILTNEFLQYTLAQGNDLISPNPRYQFPGLKSGDRRCLCATRRYEAYRAGIVTGIITGATHQDALNVVPLLR